MTLLICYSSCEGQARKIAETIAADQRETDIVMADLSAQEQWPDPAQFDKILIGASIRYGKFRPVVHRYVDHYQSALASRPSAFFGVCLTARKPNKDEPENSVYMQKFAKAHSWQPNLRAMFAGALRYSVYNWWQVKLIQMIMKMTGGSTDRSQDIEFTDWQKVAQFAVRFNQL
ncbi:menaquinone-dependent protoporphyrinogen IX dehydrogenase [Celerinatantimonas yamalensis]|uniref:Protoporphyrinogen IX dehydrogenase [quinone] n=1 Tax=Celerinatantimonas yamalensis TaxID=559956 RepID=A0ABW9G9E2_9GAMM